MSRPLAIALLLSLAAPLAHAQEVVAALDVLDAAAREMNLADREAFAADEEADVDEEAYDDEESYDEDVEYCGGGEMSVVDLAFDEMEYGDVNTAHRDLVAGLQNGTVQAWERARGVALLAELQLRRGQPGRAIVNFRRAERMEAGVTEASRVALATALYLRGETRAAHEEASAAHDQQCSDQWALAACYGANIVLARTAEDDGARRAATDAATSLRDAHPDLAEAFDALDARVTGS